MNADGELSHVYLLPLFQKHRNDGPALLRANRHRCFVGTSTMLQLKVRQKKKKNEVHLEESDDEDI